MHPIQHQKVNLRFSYENAMTIFVKLGMWVVGGGAAQVLPTWSVVTKFAYLIPHLHICSDHLITKKSNIQSSVWATLMKLGMWVVMGTSTTHVVCSHQMRIFNTSFAYLFSLANIKKGKYPEFCMGHSDETWYVGCGGHKYYTHQVCGHRMCIFNTSFAYICSDWLIKKGNYPEFCLSYTDETWYRPYW